MAKNTARQIVMGSRKEIRDDLIQMLKKGETFWDQPWFEKRPFNPVTKVRYKGVNYVRLTHFAGKKGYKDSRWVTFKQIQEKGWTLKKGSQGCMCEKWRFEEKPVKKKDANGNFIKDANGNYVLDPKETEQVTHVNYFKVFNAECIEGIDPLIEKVNDIRLGRYVFENTPIRVTKGSYPAYDRSSDEILLPDFRREDDKIHAFYMKLVEGTDYSGRIKRDLSFGKEGLVDRIGASFLAADTYLPIQAGNVSEPEIEMFVTVLEEDPDFVFKAAKIAEQAVGWIEDVTGFEEEG